MAAFFWLLQDSQEGPEEKGAGRGAAHHSPTPQTPSLFILLHVLSLLLLSHSHPNLYAEAPPIPLSLSLPPGQLSHFHSLPRPLGTPISHGCTPLPSRAYACTSDQDFHLDPSPAASRPQSPSPRPLLPKPRLFWLLSLPQRALSLRPAASICSDVGAGIPEPGGPARATGWGEVPGGSALGGPACPSPAPCGAGSAPRNPTGAPGRAFVSGPPRLLMAGDAVPVHGAAASPPRLGKPLWRPAPRRTRAAVEPLRDRGRERDPRARGPGSGSTGSRVLGGCAGPAGEEAPRGRREKQEKERRAGGERVRPSRRGEARGRGWEASSSRTTGRKDGAGAPRPPRGWGAAVRSRVGEGGVGRGASTFLASPLGLIPADRCLRGRRPRR